MTGENRQRNMELLLEKGADNLKAAQALLQLGLWDDAVSRAYYAAFHHVQALLMSEGLEARTHQGTHDLLYMHFVRAGRLDADISKKLAALQKFREQADYASAFRFAESGARAEVANADAICAAMRHAIGTCAP